MKTTASVLLPAWRILAIWGSRLTTLSVLTSWKIAGSGRYMAVAFRVSQKARMISKSFVASSE